MYIQPAFQARDQLAVEELIESHPFATLFAMRDGKDYEQIIWKAVKPDRATVHREVVE